MLVAGLLSAGVPFSVVEEAVGSLRIEGCSVRHGTKTVSGIKAVTFAVDAPANDPCDLTLGEVRRILDAANIPEQMRRRALNIFERLFSVEARLHGRSCDDVHLHEAGCADTLADVVASSAAIDFLAPDTITCSPLPMGRGFVECSHGTLPLPAPAALELLKGFEIHAVDVDGELVTPTGAAILAATVKAVVRFPSMVLESVGYGAGTMSFGKRPNMLRVLRGERRDPEEAEYVIEANIDDMNPQLFDHLCRMMLLGGAIDVWLTPVQMKKGRPAVLVSALCGAGSLDKVGKTLLAESTTIGYRYHPVQRRRCARILEAVETKFGSVRFKVAYERGKPVNAQPEFEDLERLAVKASAPLKEVLAEAMGAYHSAGGGHEPQEVKRNGRADDSDREA